MKRKLSSAVIVGCVVFGAAVAAYASTQALPLGPSSRAQETVFKGYYDGHKDVYLVTDVSSKSQATALHINYSAELAKVKGAPEQYFIRGRAAAGQLSVFASEPGEATYNPLWDEKFVSWKAGVKPVLLVKDDQITGLAKKGKLTISDPHVVLNAPITSVGK